MERRPQLTINHELALLDDLSDLVADRKVLTEGQFRVLAAIHSFGKATGNWFPSYAAISKRARVSRSTVGDALIVLKETNFITIESQKRDNGGTSSNLYTFNLDVITRAVDEANGTKSQNELDESSGLPQTGERTPPSSHRSGATPVTGLPQTGERTPLTLNQPESEPEKKPVVKSKEPKAEHPQREPAPNGDSSASALSDSDSKIWKRILALPPTEERARQHFMLGVSQIWAKPHKLLSNPDQQYAADRRSTERMFDDVWAEHRFTFEVCQARYVAALTIAREAKTSLARNRMAWFTERVKLEVLAEKKTGAVA